MEKEDEGSQDVSGKAEQNLAERRPARNTAAYPALVELDEMVRDLTIRRGTSSEMDVQGDDLAFESGRRSTKPDGSGTATPQVAQWLGSDAMGLRESEEAVSLEAEAAAPIVLQTAQVNTQPLPLVLVKNKGVKEFCLSATLIILVFFYKKLGQLIEWLKQRRL